MRICTIRQSSIFEVDINAGLLAGPTKIRDILQDNIFENTGYLQDSIIEFNPLTATGRIISPAHSADGAR